MATNGKVAEALIFLTSAPPDVPLVGLRASQDAATSDTRFRVKMSVKYKD